jgi:hypothetical protein
LLLSAELSTEELQLLIWVAEQIPRRDIAGWLGISYDAAKKRIARLSFRVRQLAVSSSARLTDAERDYVKRFLRRAGAEYRRWRRSPMTADKEPKRRLKIK